MYFEYSDQPYGIRADMSGAYREIWAMIARPGNWWKGEDRVSIATELRHAATCPLCVQRKPAMSGLN